MASFCPMPQSSQTFLSTLTLSGLWCAELRPKARSIASGHQDNSCAQHMFTKNSLCFISSSSPFISLLLFQPTLSFSALAPHQSLQNRWSPQRGSFKPFNYSLCCFLQLFQLPQKPCCEWQPETSVPRASSTNRGGGLKEGSKLGERQWKEAKGKRQRKTFQILSINQVWQHCTACCQV